MALLTQRLHTAAAAFPRTRAADEILYEAVSSDEPLGRSLRDCAVVSAKVVLASPAEGVGGTRPQRITDVKRTKLIRYLTAVEKQGALLTNADLCFLLGIHMDVIGRLLKEPACRTLPTRQREWERRAAWLDGIVAAGERMTPPTDRRVVASFAQSPQSTDDVTHVAEIPKLIVAGVSTADIQESTGAPRWLVDRLSQHPSVALLARLASDTPFRLAV